ncbi:MAG: nucleotidyltransferase family protein [Firmicutes bacterium]|nr:nucleotidyltransferase family protein [Bacillota bacterium]
MIPDRPAVVAILLAAGLSRRMGRPKQTLAWGESTLVMAVGAQIAAMGLPVVAVVPEWLKEPVPLWARAWIVNPQPEQGLSGSIRLGVQAAEALGRWEAMAFFLADQPFVTEADTAVVLEAFWRRQPTVHAVRPLYNGHPGHPVVVDRVVWSAADQLDGDAGFGRWLKEGLELVPVAVEGRPDPATDLDTWEDYQRYRNAAKD